MSMMFRRFTLALALLAGLSSFVAAETQPRPYWLDQEALVITPEDYDPARSYPVLVVIPPTGWAAYDYWANYYAQSFPVTDFLVVALPGVIESEDYLPDFMAFVGWYNAMFQREFNRLRDEYNFDRERIALLGYSVGGDISWALTALNPGLFTGFVAGGTRCSYPLGKSAAQTLKDRGFRAFFYMGAEDEDVRKNGMKAACTRLKNEGVEYHYQEVDGAMHSDSRAAMAMVADFRNVMKPRVGKAGTVAQASAHTGGKPAASTPVPTPRFTPRPKTTPTPEPTVAPQAVGSGGFTVGAWDRETQVAKVFYQPVVDPASSAFGTVFYEGLAFLYRKFPKAGFLDVCMTLKDGRRFAYLVQTEDYEAAFVNKTISPEELSNRIRPSQW